MGLSGGPAAAAACCRLLPASRSPTFRPGGAPASPTPLPPVFTPRLAPPLRRRPSGVHPLCV